MQNKDMHFNGNDTTTGTSGYVNNIYDPVKFCAYCGKEFPTPSDSIHYCPFCGQAIQRTYTGSVYKIYWNLPADGTVTYPRDGIVKPITIC
jgi:rRNA maturation endonuclease Nob1